MVGSVEKMCDIGRKWEKNRGKVGRFGTNFPFFLVPFSPLFHNLATFPSGSFDELCQPNWPTRKMEFRDWPTWGELLHSARTVQCFWNIHPASTPLDSPHRTIARVPISALCSSCWHTRNCHCLF